MFGYTAFAELPFLTVKSSDQLTEGVADFYFSRFGFVTSTGDSPSRTLYDPRVLQPLQFDRSILNSGRIGGLTIATGEIVLANGDGALDSFAISHAFDGRTVTVKLGSTDFATSEFGQVFNGVMQDVVLDENRVIVNIRDRLLDLELPIQSDFYEGTGGNEGGADLKGKPKPIAYGKVRNVPAVLVDKTNLIYQVHDGSVQDISAVYDRGVSLNETTAAPGLGEYKQTSTAGTFQLGGAPDGTITADVEGDNSTDFAVKTGEIVQRILLNRASIASSLIDTTAFTKLNTASTAKIGIWIGPEQQLMTDVVDRLLFGIGAYGYFTRLGLFTVGVFEDPKAVGDVVKQAFGEVDIIAIRREALPGFGNPPIWRAQVTYKVNYMVQTDLAGGSSVGQQEFAVEPFRLAVATDLAVKSRFSLADDPEPIAALYDNSSDAQNEATRILNLHKTPRALFEFVTKTKATKMKIGDVISITYPRWELKNGQLARIIGISENAERNEFALTVFV